MRHKPGFQTRYMVSNGFADVARKLSTFAVSSLPFDILLSCPSLARHLRPLDVCDLIFEFSNGLAKLDFLIESLCQELFLHVSYGSGFDCRPTLTVSKRRST